MFCCRLTGAKVRGLSKVPLEDFFQAEYEAADWDTDGFFQPSVADNELVVRSPRRAGYYQIRVAVRWNNPWHPAAPSPIPRPSVDDLFRKHYNATVEINGHGLGTEGRSTALAVAGARATTQHFAAERNLEANDTVSVKLWQGFGAEVHAYVFLSLRRLSRKTVMLTSEAADSE